MTIPVFVDGRRLLVASNTTAGSAAAAADSALAEPLANGSAYLTDGRGIALAPDTVVGAGMIVRVVRSARKRPDADA